jgi:EpsI family protein
VLTQLSNESVSGRLAGSHRTRSQSAISVAVLAVIAMTVAYGPVLIDLVREWSINPLYSYGFAVPFISGYIVVTRWRIAQNAIGAPDYSWGPSLVIVAGVMFVIGEVGTAERLQQISFIVMIAGVVTLLFGRGALRHLWFAIVYLLLMSPIWTDLIGWLQVPSQIESGRIAVFLLHAMDIPAVQEGTLIYLPRIVLEVLRECSGVNQLVSIFALTVPAAYLWITDWFRRVLFVAVSLGIAYLSNGARIGLVGLLAQKGIEKTSPSLHLLQGLLIAAVGYGLISAVFALLVRSNRPAKQDQPDESASALVPTRWPERLAAATLHRRCSVDVVLAMFVLACAGGRIFLPRTGVPLRADLSSLPNQIGAWTRESTWDPADASDPAVDQMVRLTYRRGTVDRVHLYIGYQRYQQAGKGLSEALPKFVQGHTSIYDVRVAPNLTALNQIENSTGTKTRGVLYWFDVDGFGLANRYDAKRHLLWNAVTRGRTNGAVIAVTWATGSGVDFETSRDRIVDFIRSLVPVLSKYLPSHA